MSDISFVIGKPVGKEYPSIVKSNVESKGISFEDAWVDYCHEILGRLIDTSDKNSLNRTLSLALGVNVIAPETFLTYQMITDNGQARTSPVLMLLSEFCVEQNTGREVQITREATEYLSEYVGKILMSGGLIYLTRTVTIAQVLLEMRSTMVMKSQLFF